MPGGSTAENEVALIPIGARTRRRSEFFERDLVQPRQQLAEQIERGAAVGVPGTRCEIEGPCLGAAEQLLARRDAVPRAEDVVRDPRGVREDVPGAHRGMARRELRQVGAQRLGEDDPPLSRELDHGGRDDRLGDRRDEEPVIDADEVVADRPEGLVAHQPVGGAHGEDRGRRAAGLDPGLERVERRLEPVRVKAQARA